MVRENPEQGGGFVPVHAIEDHFPEGDKLKHKDKIVPKFQQYYSLQPAFHDLRSQSHFSTFVHRITRKTKLGL